MHPDVNILMVQSRVDDMHRAGAASRLAAEARRTAAATRGIERRSQLHPVTHPSFFRRVVTRLAF